MNIIHNTPILAVASAMLACILLNSNAMAGSGSTTAQGASANDIFIAGGSTHSIDVVWDNNQTPTENLDFTTIDLSDITVTGPGGILTVLSASTSPSSNAPLITATYTIGAPGGSWDFSDNGTYIVDVNSNEVFLEAPLDFVDNFISQPALTSFSVNIVPEPASLVLLGLGGMALLGIQRRRRLLQA